jgi:hypothetical protein
VVASSAALLDRAVEIAGSSEFGVDRWQQGLEELLVAVEADCDSDPDAVERIESIVVERLVQRLRVEAWYGAHGQEAGAPVVGPLVITGLPRTGTTAVHHILSLDQRFRFLRSWEVLDPVPPPTTETEHVDPRRPVASPGADVRHIATVDGPAEDWPIHAMAFDHGELVLPVPSYTAWWRQRRHDTAFPYHERVLRLLHAHRPPHHWLLKMPSYLFMLEEMAAHYPDARFVMTHRDPLAVMASTCSTVAASRRQRVPSWVQGGDFGAGLLHHWADGVRQALAARARIGEHRFLDVGQHEVEADAVAIAARALDLAGMELDVATADAIATWAATNRRGSRGEHRYALEDYGLGPDEVLDAFAPYLERFGDLCRPDR